MLTFEFEINGTKYAVNMDRTDGVVFAIWQQTWKNQSPCWIARGIEMFRDRDTLNAILQRAEHMYQNV